jgi:predicted aminopeptidase
LGRLFTKQTIALAVILFTIVAGIAGCEAGYIARAAYEESLLLWRRKPIQTVLARGDLSPELRGKLETVLKVRKFAADGLGLNVGNSYKSVSEVDQRAVVWVVMAAPRDSLKPYTWWFPIVGRVPYRGYFDKDRAIAEAGKMEHRGYDTMVRPAVAFSSLGFFNDPLLSNLLKLGRVELAGVIIHELFHRTYFLASDVMFDESSATFVGSAGAIRFFANTEGPDSVDARAARGILEADLDFAAFLKRETARLEALYKSGMPAEEIVQRRVPIFASIKSDYAELKPRLSGLERFDLDKQPINNAVLINYLIYFHDLDNFARLQQIYAGNLHDTIKAIIALAESDPDQPFAAVERGVRLGPVHGAESADSDASASGFAAPASPSGTSAQAAR